MTMSYILDKLISLLLFHTLFERRSKSDNVKGISTIRAPTIGLRTKENQLDFLY